MKAVIMAGGEGKRLRPITCTIPKPMTPVLDAPVIEHILRLLSLHEVREVSCALFYLPNVIKERIGDGTRYGVSVSYSLEDTPLGTAGCVKLAAKNADDTVLVMSGDALTDIDITSALEAHRRNRSKLTIVLKRVDSPCEYGVVLTDSAGKITRFIEKPMRNEVFSDLANTGIYIIEPDILELIPENRQFDFSRDLFPMLLSGGTPIFGYETDAYWCDIGDVEQYRQAQTDVLLGRCKLDWLSPHLTSGCFCAKSAVVSEKAMLISPFYIGENVQIGDGALIGPNAVIGRRSRIGSGASVKNSVLFENVRVREHAELRGAVLCEDAHADTGASIFEGAVLGARSSIGKRAVLKPDVLVWPEKHLESDAVYHEDVVWRSDAAQASSDETSGYCDGELSPERAVRIGAAFGSIHDNGQRICVCTDGTQRSSMLKHAMIAGVISQGVDVCDMGCISRSSYEFYIRSLCFAGGAYIRRGMNGGHEAEMLLCDSSGAELSAADMRRVNQALSHPSIAPKTDSPLGVISDSRDGGRAYEANVLNHIGAGKSRYKGKTVVICTDGETFDHCARILLEKGMRVMLLAEGSHERLYNQMLHAKAELGCVCVDDGITSCIYRERLLNAEELLFIFALDAMKRGCGKEFLLPVNVPEEYVSELRKLGASVKRAPAMRSKWMREAIADNVFQPEFFEPEAGVARLCELYVSDRLQDHIDRLPPVHTSDGAVGCSWRQVGKVLRSLVESEGDGEVELIDGVKVKTDDGWVLVRPNDEYTTCRVVAGSMRAEYSSELCDIYLNRVKAVLEDTDGK